MVKKLLLLSFLSFIGFQLKAQVPDPCPSNSDPAADDCASACIYCNFNGYVGSTSGYTGGFAAGFCGTLENEQWFGFIAGSSAATFTATTTNCTIGNGVQIALYSDCNGVPVPNGCYMGCAGCAATPASVTVTLTPGVNYFLLLDGYAGDVCDFAISVTPPSAVQAPNVGPIGAIQGPTNLCPGATVVYKTPVVTGAGAYVWDAPAGYLINGEPPPLTVNAPGGNMVTITIGPAGGQICLTALNSCDQNNPVVCKTVTVAPIPPKILPPVVVCNEDLPYDLPWGDQAFSTGLYQTTLVSYLGCDSIVKKQVNVKPPIIKNLAPQTICAGTCITVCGEQYCDGGNFSHVCESFQGCDSLINFAILLLDPQAMITGNLVLSCATTSTVLTAAATAGTKIWKNLAGSVLGTGNTLTVTQAGTYILNVTASAGAALCSKSDTVVVTGNTTPPTLSATGGVIGCAATTVQLTTTTNATTPSFVWSGPGGFTSASATPTVSAQGTYTVTVTNPSTGCTASATAVVTGNTTPPTASATGTTLTCAITSAQINSSTNAGTATYQWAGPSPFTSTQANPTVNAAGTYTVTITNTTNGCTASATTTVLLNNTVPGASASAAGVIGCLTPNITLSGSSPASGVTYAWTGGATTPSISVGTAGAYTVTITGTNGCTSTAIATATGNTTLPNASAVGDTVSCGTQTIAISGNSTTPGVTYAWAGPNGFSSTQQNPSVTAPGTYTVTVTAGNGCTSTANATLVGNFAVPNAGATGGIITCSSSTTTISGTSTTPGSVFAWSGPGNFMSTLANETVNTVGDYTLTVTGPNGCTTTATATVSPDANIPNASATGGTLDCNVTSLVINGNSTTPGVNLSWTGPNGFTSTQPSPTVSAPGQYILSITNQANGCSAQATANVNLDDVQPGATASGDTLTCTAPTVTLSGNSTTANVSWMWTGPNGFSSTQQNPAVTDAGPYALTVTGTNGCTSAASVDVPADQNIPQASATTGTLTCSLTTLVLNGSATLPVTYKWAGPAGFTANVQNPSVTEPGDYTVTVTSANGCTDVEMVTVAQDIAVPGVTTTGNTIDCNNPQVQVTANSVSPGAVYVWSTTDPTPTATVTVNGNYTVTVTGTNGCISTAIATVQIDTVTAALQASAPDVLTCSAQTVGIQAVVTPGTSPLLGLAWVGPNSFSSTLEDPSVTEPGDYILVATTTNGCTSQIQTTVIQDIVPPTATAASGSTLTCVVLSSVLNGGSTSPGAVFDWSGPGGFNSTLEDPTATVDGTYTVTVTGTNGCTSIATTDVLIDVAQPGAAVVSTNNLDCDDLTTTLQGSSPSTSPVTYAWSGAIVSTQQSPSASVPGTFILTVTGQNGCTSTATVDVTQDIVAPDASAVGDTVDCISGQAPLQGNSTVAGVTYSWSGPNGFMSTQQNPIVTDPGAYTVTVTGLNACKSTATAQVFQNISSPVVVLDVVNGLNTITCAQTDVTIVGTISTPGATGVWGGPGGFNSTLDSITVATEGVYAYTVTAQNGCISTATSTILLDVEPPQNVTATGGLLNCTFPSITITSGSSTTGVNYVWEGPGGFSSNLQNTPVTNPGGYTVTVTDPTNGCTTVAFVVVTQDPTVPTIDVTTNVITCNLPSVVLDAQTTTPNVSFQWSGPGGFTSTIEDPANISTPGTYTVVAKAQSGCTSTFSIDVVADLATPGATATGDTITCTAQSGIISSSSQTQGVTYSWGGPGAFTSNQPNPVVTLVGTYTVTITAANGCISTASAVVSPDINAPQINVTGGTLTCTITDITLNATSNVGVSWQWSGPGGFSSTVQNPTVTVDGGYIVVATAANGCSISSGATVEADTDGPGLTLGTPDELNCTTTQVPLSVTAQGPGNFDYQWTTQAGTILSGGNSPNPTVSQAAVYTIVVTNNLNGCTSEGNVEVDVNTDTPSAALIEGKDVNCYGETDGVISIKSVTGGTPPYLYSIDNSPFSASSIFTSLAPRTYSIVIQDANGCEYETTATLSEPEELLVNLGQDTIVHLGQTIDLSLADITNFPDRVEQLQVNPAGIFPVNLDSSEITLLPTYSFQYTVTVIDTNGCKAKDTRLVIVDKTRYVYIPNIFNPGSDENNIFYIFGGEDVEKIKSFQVFDRWGNAVHEYFDFFPNDPATGWDGKVRGELANPAVFVYFAEILFKDGETVLFKGDVMLQR